MLSFDKLFVTDIRPPTVVQTKKDTYFEMPNRPYFGVSFCTKGQITYTMNGKTYVSKPGYAVLTPEGASYHRVTDSDGLFPLINFYCSGLEDLKEIVVIPLDDPQDCIKRFKALQRLFLRNESRIKIFSAFYELLDLLISSNEQNSEKLALVVKYIEEHIQDPNLSNVELAKYLGISEVYLRKQFQSHYQITPKQYILDVRIRKAKQLLIDTPFTVTAIAEECGFASVYHFCRAFRQRTGEPPPNMPPKTETIRYNDLIFWNHCKNRAALSSPVFGYYFTTSVITYWSLNTSCMVSRWRISFATSSFSAKYFLIAFVSVFISTTWQKPLFTRI